MDGGGVEYVGAQQLRLHHALEYVLPLALEEEFDEGAERGQELAKGYLALAQANFAWLYADEAVAKRDHFGVLPPQEEQY